VHPSWIPLGALARPGPTFDPIALNGPPPTSAGTRGGDGWWARSPWGRLDPDVAARGRNRRGHHGWGADDDDRAWRHI